MKTHFTYKGNKYKYFTLEQTFTFGKGHTIAEVMRVYEAMIANGVSPLTPLSDVSEIVTLMSGGINETSLLDQWRRILNEN